MTLPIRQILVNGKPTQVYMDDTHIYGGSGLLTGAPSPAAAIFEPPPRQCCSCRCFANEFVDDLADQRHTPNGNDLACLSYPAGIPCDIQNDKRACRRKVHRLMRGAS